MAQKLDKFLGEISHNLTQQNGAALSGFLSLKDVHSIPVGKAFEKADSNPYLVTAKIASPWSDIVTLHLQACCTKDPLQVVELQNSLAQNLHSVLSQFTRWILPVVITVNQELQWAAARADQVLVERNEKPFWLEQAARTMNKAFSVCATDRFSTLDGSRKWGVYAIVNLLFKTYFRLASTNLCPTILRSMGSAGLPPLSEFPKSEQVTFKYYTGVLHFFNEKFEEASQDLLFALKHGSVPSDGSTKRNKIRILRYLIPTQIVRGYLPDPKLIGKYQALKVYHVLVNAIKQGNLAAFDKVLKDSQPTLIKWGTWLVVEKARLLVVRQLFFKTWIMLEKSSRLTIAVLNRAVSVSMKGTIVTDEHVCMLVVNLIDKAYMKGYVSLEKQTLVLSNKDPFPSLQS
ncbi:COP9 signalosome (CSN) subunit [Kappamyces sp. JEL0829]|nr:COP9 signalosome (CSN) subunit [Kappamyces sp. JEL0829]